MTVTVKHKSFGHVIPFVQWPVCRNKFHKNIVWPKEFFHESLTDMSGVMLGALNFLKRMSETHTGLLLISAFNSRRVYYVRNVLLQVLSSLHKNCLAMIQNTIVNGFKCIFKYACHISYTGCCSSLLYVYILVQ